jgi:hypothetical protein
MGTGH